MEINKARELGLFRFKVIITDFFEGSDEELYIELGEPNMKDFDTMSKKKDASVDDYSKLFKTYLTDHNFTSNGNKAKSEDVVKLFVDMPELFVDITGKWFNECPLMKLNREKSGNSVQ